MTRPPAPRSLPDWLGEALDGLADDARQRIARELTTHYEDALDHYRAHHLAEPEAARRALSDLGDPHAARRAFRRTAPTVTEARRYERVRFPLLSSAARTAFAMLYGLAGTVAWWAGTIDGPSAASMAALAAAFLLVTPRLLGPRPSPRTVMIAWTLLCPLQSLPPLWGWSLALHDDVGWLNAALLLGAYLLFVRWWLGPLWRKAAFLAPLTEARRSN